MRAVAYIVPTFWTRGSGKKLRSDRDAQVLAMYVMTAPGSNMIGLYYLPLTTIAHETGLTINEVREVFPRIAEIAKYDEDAEIVWVPESAKHQIGETMALKDKRRGAVLRELAMAGSHPFAREFLDRYRDPYQLEIGLKTGSSELPDQGPSIQSEAPSKGLLPEGMPRSLIPPFLSSSDQDTDQPDRSGSPAMPTFAERARVVLRDRITAELRWGRVEIWPEVSAICGTFVEVWGRPDAPRHGGDPRAQAILNRAQEGYTVEQLQAAIRGSKLAENIRERRDYQALTTILRDAAQVDKFSALAAAGYPAPGVMAVADPESARRRADAVLVRAEAQKVRERAQRGA